MPTVTQAAIPNLDRQICPSCSAIYGSAYDLCPTDGTVLIPGGGDELLGTTLADKYVIDECIGEGGMGRVYLAHHARLQKRTFAIKILLGDLAADPTMRKRFEQEAEAASRLQHPNVVSVLDFGKTEGGLLYLVMEFVAGQSLSDVMKAGPMPEARVVAITQKLCLGLAHAHKEALVHRDFKPDNVVLANRDDSDTPRILDFGLAIVRSPEEASIRLTGSGLMVGTPAYISPEQARGGRVDHRTDLFSLGISVYEMLAGVLPFSGDAIEIMYANTKLDAPSISERNPAVTVSREMEAVVRKLMARDPDQRFQSAREVFVVLKALAGDVDTQEAEDSLANLLASQPELNTSAESKITVPIAPSAIQGADTVLDAPTVGGSARSKTKILSAAVAAVIVLGLAIFALLRFGGSEAPGKGPSTEPLQAVVVPPLDQGDASLVAGPAQDAGANAEEVPVIESHDRDAPDPDLESVDATQDRATPSKADRSDKLAERARKERQRRESEQEARESKLVSADAKPEDRTQVATVTSVATNTERPAPPVEIKEKPPLPSTDPKPEPVLPEPIKVTVPKAPVVPTVLDAVATIQTFSAKGSLSTQVVRRAIDRALPEFRQCYKEAAQTAKKNKAGALAISLEINELGRASKIKVGSYALPGLSGCVGKSLKTVRTRVMPDVGTVRVSLRLVFATKS